MRVRLLGTGSADRLPNPWCGCARCTRARATGERRDRTSVLIDDTLLIDPGPDLGAHGVDLTGVRTVLITHDHPDHLDPAFLLAWAWGDHAALTVAGPPGALARCRDWVAPDAPVRFQPLAPGDALAAGALDVRALPAAHSVLGGRAHDGSALLYEITGDARMLHAADTAALPHAQLTGRYDLVLLECTFGDATDHGAAHLDLPAFARELARLRADDRLAPGARVVAVHVSHHTPADLPERLAGLGAEVLDDGTVISLGPTVSSGRRLLVTGGARSGKSAHAEALLARRPVTYIATAPTHPDDPEWGARITVHRARRPAHWRTVELSGQPADDLAGLLAGAEPGDTLLVDCLTLWLTGVLDATGWDDPTAAASAAERATADLVAALAATAADVVLVSNEVGSGVVPPTVSGRLFRDLLGRLNAQVAAACDDVELVSAGLPLTLKGAPWTRS